VAREDRQRDAQVVGISIVERDRQRTRRQCAVPELPYCPAQDHDVEQLPQPATELVEALGVDGVGVQRVRLRQHAVEDQHGQTGPRAGRRQQVQQRAQHFQATSTARLTT
jgi:hypothetical protein